MLAIDCGNSRIKWLRFESGRSSGRGEASLREGDPYAELAAALVAGIDRVLVANVAGSAVAERIREVVVARLGVEPEFTRVVARAHGLECAYRDPATLGVDRWLAMLAGRRRCARAFAVVAAGTAVTFDAVDGGGHHLGGLILPGEGLMLEALATGTKQIGLVARAREPLQGLELLGRSTGEAAGRGSRLAVAAAIDRAFGVFAAASDEAPALVLTGGDASGLAAWLASEAEVRADLVLEGLAVVAGALESPHA